MATLALNDRQTVEVTAIDGQTDFPVDFPALQVNGAYEGLFCRRRRDGADTLLTLDDFDVVDPNDGGFTARLVAPAVAGDQLLFFGKRSISRQQAFQPGGAVRTDPLESEFTALTALAQEARRDLDRTLRVPIGEAGADLPAAADRASAYLAFDAAGAPYPAVGPVDGAVPVSVYMATLLTSASAAAVRQSLGLGDWRWVEQHGAVGDGVTDDTAAIQAALDAGPGIVAFRSTTYKVTNLNKPNNVSCRGAGMGFASNMRTVLSCVATNGACVQYQGYYQHMEGVLIVFAGAAGDKANVVGVKYGLTAGGVQVTNTSMAYVTVQGFGVGIQNNKTFTSFAHLHYRVYIKDCVVGTDFKYCNNVIFTACFLESCGTLGTFDTFTNVVFSAGCVLEIFGDLRLSEQNDSKAFVLTTGWDFVVRDSYCEIGTSASAGTLVQFMQVTTVKGLAVENTYFNRSANLQPAMIEFMDANSSCVSIRGNYLKRGTSVGTDYFVDGHDAAARATVYGFEISNNAVKSSTLPKPIEFTPVFYEAGVVIGDITFTTLEANTWRSGDTMHVNLYAVVNAPGTVGAGALTIGVPMPMFAGLGASNEAHGSISCTVLSSAFVNFAVRILSGAAVLQPFRDYTTSLKANNLVAGSTIRISISYPAPRPAI